MLIIQILQLRFKLHGHLEPTFTALVAILYGVNWAKFLSCFSCLAYEITSAHLEKLYNMLLCYLCFLLAIPYSIILQFLNHLKPNCHSKLAQFIAYLKSYICTTQSTSNSELNSCNDTSVLNWQKSSIFCAYFISEKNIV